MPKGNLCWVLLSPHLIFSLPKKQKNPKNQAGQGIRAKIFQLKNGSGRI
ncbi:hypothetical protein D082_05090 [Synechocystis sp. PCC 6714]|nr:hypothetical protein D082_05090 [Synechocystis sp. PCC 6714]